MADEIYLQKASEFSGGEYIGANEDNELYKGICVFMVVGMKSSIPYVIKASPEISINGPLLCGQMDDCITILAENGFQVRGVVIGNHSANVSAFSTLRLKYNSQSKLFIIHPKNHGKRCFLFYDNVHLIKNIRNNLLYYKKYVFPAFEFTIGDWTVSSDPGFIALADFHRLHEKDNSLEAYLRKAPKLNQKSLHPGNNKQDVQLALSIFDEYHNCWF